MEIFKLVGKIVLEGMDAVNKGLADVENKFSTVGSTITKVGVGMTAGITTPIVALGKSILDVSIGFEKSMKQVQAVSGATGEEFETLSNLAREMGKTTIFSASECANALYYMGMAGWKTEEMIDGLPGVLNLAASTGADLAEASDIVTNAITALGYSAKDAGRLADVMAAACANSNVDVHMLGETFKYVAPIAGSFGYTMEDTAVMAGLLGSAGIQASQAGTTLKAVLVRLATDAGASSKSLGALGVLTEKLGVQFYNTDGTMRNLSDVILDARKAWKGLTAEQQAQYAKTIAGLEAMTGWNLLMNATDDSLVDLTDAIKESNGVAQEMADIMSDSFWGQLKTLGSQLGEVALKLGQILLPYAKQFVEFLSQMVEKFDKLSPSVKEAIVKFAAIAAAIGPVMTVLGPFVTLIGNLIGLIGGGSGVAAVAGAVGTAGAGAAAAGGGGLIAALGSLVASFAPVAAAIAGVIAVGVLLYKNWDEIKEASGRIWESIVSTVKSAGESIGQAFEKLKETGKAIWDGIKDVAQSAWDNIVAVVSGARDALFGAFQSIKDGALRIWEGVQDIASSIWEGICGVVENAKTALQGIFSNIKEAAGQIWEGIKDIAQTAWETITGIVRNAWTAITNICKNAFDALKGIFSNIHDAAMRIWEGVQDVASTCWDAICSLVDAAKEVLAGIFATISETASAIWEAAKEAALEAWENIKSTVASAWENLKERFAEIKNSVVEIWESAKEAARQAWENVKETVKGAVDNIKEQVKGFIDNAKSSFEEFAGKAKGIFQDLASGVKGVFSEVKKQITDTISACAEQAKKVISSIKDGVSKAAESAKGVADNIAGTITNAANKAVDGAKNLVSNIAPGISKAFSTVTTGVKNAVSTVASKVTGTKKFAEGGVMTNRTVFGYDLSTNTRLLGGEKGPEAIAPIDVLQDYVREAAAGANDKLIAVMEKMQSTMERYLPEMANMQVVTNTGVLVGQLAPQMDEELARLWYMRERRS